MEENTSHLYGKILSFLDRNKYVLVSRLKPDDDLLVLWDKTMDYEEDDEDEEVSKTLSTFHDSQSEDPFPVGTKVYFALNGTGNQIKIASGAFLSSFIKINNIQQPTMLYSVQLDKRVNTLTDVMCFSKSEIFLNRNDATQAAMKKKSAGNNSQRQGIESTSVSQEHEETVNDQQISSHAQVIESNSVSQEHEESVTDDQISSQAQGTKKSSANNPSSTSTSANNNEDEKTTNDDSKKSVANGNSRTSQDEESMNDKQMPSSTSNNKDNMENEKSSNESNTQNQLISLIDDEDTSNNNSKNLSKGNEVVNLVDSDDEESEQSAKNATNESSSTTQSSAAAKNKSSLSKRSSNTENVGNESSSSKKSSQESSDKESANNKRKNSPSSKQSSKQRENEDKKRSNKGNQNNKLTKSSQLQDGQKLHLLRYMRYRNEYRVIECFFSKKKERTKPERIVVQLGQGYFMYYKNGTELQFHKGSFRQFYLSSIYLDNELAEQHGQKLQENVQQLRRNLQPCEIEFYSEYEDQQYQWDDCSDSEIDDENEFTDSYLNNERPSQSSTVSYDSGVEKSTEEEEEEEEEEESSNPEDNNSNYSPEEEDNSSPEEEDVNLIQHNKSYICDGNLIHHNKSYTDLGLETSDEDEGDAEEKEKSPDEDAEEKEKSPDEDVEEKEPSSDGEAMTIQRKRTRSSTKRTRPSIQRRRIVRPLPLSTNTTNVSSDNANESNKKDPNKKNPNMIDSKFGNKELKKSQRTTLGFPPTHMPLRQSKCKDMDDSFQKHGKKMKVAGTTKKKQGPIGKKIGKPNQSL